MTDWPQVTVSIGRNYGHDAKSPVRHNSWYGRKMSAKVWRQYRSDLNSTLLLIPGANAEFTTLGGSAWRDESGIVWEDSFTIGVTGIAPVYHTTLRHHLADLCKRYQQDSIAVTVADPSFIPASK